MFNIETIDGSFICADENNNIRLKKIKDESCIWFVIPFNEGYEIISKYGIAICCDLNNNQQVYGLPEKNNNPTVWYIQDSPNGQSKEIYTKDSEDTKYYLWHANEELFVTPDENLSEEWNVSESDPPRQEKHSCDNTGLLIACLVLVFILILIFLKYT